MNKRIKELAEQCTSIPNHLNPPVFDQEKFAELIVRECADYIGGFRGRDLRQHFGVEE